MLSRQYLVETRNTEKQNLRVLAAISQHTLVDTFAILELNLLITAAMHTLMNTRTW